MHHALHNPIPQALTHVDLDALEHAASTFAEFVGDTFGELTEVVTDTVTDEIVPAVGTTVRRTRRVVSSRPRTSIALAVGAIAAIIFVVWWRRRDHDADQHSVTELERVAA